MSLFCSRSTPRIPQHSYLLFLHHLLYSVTDSSFSLWICLKFSHDQSEDMPFSQIAPEIRLCPSQHILLVMITSITWISGVSWISLLWSYYLTLNKYLRGHTLKLCKSFSSPIFFLPTLTTDFSTYWGFCLQYLVVVFACLWLSISLLPSAFINCRIRQCIYYTLELET